MGLRQSTTLRQQIAQDHIDKMGTNGKAKYYSGTLNTAVGTFTGMTLLATLTFNGAFGTVATTTANGVDRVYIDVNEDTANNEANNVNGTPTLIAFFDANDVFVMQVDIGSNAGQATISGPVANGVKLPLNAPSTIDITGG